MIDSVRILGIHQYFYYYYSSTPSDITPVIRRSTVVLRAEYWSTPAGVLPQYFSLILWIEQKQLTINNEQLIAYLIALY